MSNDSDNVSSTPSLDYKAQSPRRRSVPILIIASIILCVFVLGWACAEVRESGRWNSLFTSNEAWRTTATRGILSNIGKLRADGQATATDIASLKMRLDDREATLVKSNADLKNANQQVKTLQPQVEDLTQKLADARNELQKLKTRTVTITFYEKEGCAGHTLTRTLSAANPGLRIDNLGALSADGCPTWYFNEDDRVCSATANLSP